MSSYLTYDQYKKQEKEAWVVAQKDDRERSRGLNFDKKGASKSAENFDDFKQHITIIPNPAASRRTSITSYAFPELHSKSRKERKKEPENLLMLTRTTTDAVGRRHSITVPLIPPADGERFEGGYHIERNPITGGARLVPPSKATREKDYPGRGRDPESRSSLNTSTNSIRPAGLSTINERRATSLQRMPQQSQTKSFTSKGSWRNRSRRHSIQVESISTYHKERIERQERLEQLKKKDPEKVENLTKDLERLSVTSSSVRRKNSKRRSSAQGFLHFLDLAIAH